MSVLVKALNNFTRNIYVYKNSENPVAGSEGIALTISSDIVTVYCDVAPSMASYVDGFQLYVNMGNGNYTTLGITEVTPGETGNGLKKAYSFTYNYEWLESSNYDICIVPKSTLQTGNTLNKASLYTTPSAIKNITTTEIGIAELESSTSQYLEYEINTTYVDGDKVLPNTKIYFKTISQPDEQGRAIVFDKYGSLPAGAEQPNLVLDEEEFTSTGISINKMPANSYMTMPNIEVYQPMPVLKYGEAPTPTNKCKVTFKAGVQTVGTVLVESGSKIPSGSIPEAPSVLGMEFNYWSLNGEEFDFNTLITEDIELDAVYKVATLTVTYKEGIETIATKEVAYGSTAPNISPLHPTNESGEEFIYWVGSNESEYDFSTPITEALTLTAKYVKGATDKWIMSLPNCFVGLASDIAELPIARVDNGTKALAISATSGEESAYIFHRGTLTWIKLQHYTVTI